MTSEIQFCKQRDKFSCGPIALLNADKFFGKNNTYRHLPMYQKLVNCTPEHGTYTHRMSKVLGQATRRSWIKTKEFLQGCKGCLIIIQTGDGRCERKGHFSLVCMDLYGDYYLVNHYIAHYAAVVVSWQKIYWFCRKAHRIWYVSTPVEKVQDET